MAKMFDCSTCGRTFKTARAVEDHTRDAHTNPVMKRVGLKRVDEEDEESFARRVSYVEVDTETAYGSTQRISRSIRVF